MGTREWSEQMQIHRPALERRARRLCGDRDEARDLVQDTFERAWRYRALAGSEPPRCAWFQRVLTNLFFDRRKRRRPATDASIAIEDIAIESVPPPPVTPEEALGALACISPELREVVEAHDLRGLRYREIAEHLAIPIGTVGTRLARARGQLKQLLLARTSGRERSIDLRNASRCCAPGRAGLAIDLRDASRCCAPGRAGLAISAAGSAA